MIKRVLFFCLLLTIIPWICFSQATTGIKLGGGVYQLSRINGNSEFGYEAGFFSKAELGKKASLLLELDYSVKKAEIISNERKSKLEQNFVNFRFSGSYDFNEHFFLAAGPSFSYMIHPVQSLQLIPYSYFTHFAVGIDPCIGYETARFIFIVRYEIALTVLTLESTPEAAGNILTGTHWRGVKVGVGVKL
ncbi:MAG: outer membrane beta-barrel protein [Bacteroidota bacterium]